MTASRIESQTRDESALATATASIQPLLRTSSSDAQGIRLWIAAVLFSVLAAVALAIDLPVARYFDAEGERALPNSLRKLIIMSEVFAHGTGVALLLLTVWVLDRHHRRSVLRLAACAFGAGIAADLLKLSVARIRPQSGLPTGSIWESFVGWLPVLAGEVNGAKFDRTMQSFPSAHTATGVGLAIGLSLRYPHGKWLFATLALIAASQRVVVSAHYVSDCCVGAAVACVLASFFHGPGRIAQQLQRFENHGAGSAARR